MEQNEAIYIHSESVENIASPEEIVPVLYEMFHPASVVDIGCGLGTFLHCFRQQGVKEVLGVDGDWVNRDLLYKHILPGEFQAANLEMPLVLSRKYDMVVCVEVAEHLKEEAADILVESLTKAGEIIIFSAAVKNQGGQNHINERPLSHWLDKCSRKGFIMHDVLRPLFWNNPKIAWWYKQNIFLVVNKDFPMGKIKAPAGHNGDANYEYIHPELLGLKTELFTQVAAEKAWMETELNRKSVQLEDTSRRLQEAIQERLLLKSALEEIEKMHLAFLEAERKREQEGTMAEMKATLNKQAGLLEEISSNLAGNRNELLEATRELEQKKSAVTRLEAELNHHLQALQNTRKELNDHRRMLHDIHTGNAGIKSYLKYGAKGILRKMRVVPGKLNPFSSKTGGASYDNWYLIIKESGLFDHAYYESQLAKKNIKAKDPIAHYLNKADSSFNPHPFFHSKWYLYAYPEVRKSRNNPLVHYILNGYAEGKFPNPLFDTAWYLHINHEVLDTQINPLRHFIEEGLHEGRAPNMLFDMKWIYKTYKREKGEEMIAAWMEDPDKEIGQFNFLFDAAWFRENYDLEDLKPSELIHYFIVNGKENQLSPNKLFDMRVYLKNNPDVAGSGVHPFDHFMRHGIFEGRVPWNNEKVISFQQEFTKNPEHGESFIAQSRDSASIKITKPPAGGRIGVYTNTLGNYFFMQIRDLICAGLTTSGYTPVILNEKSDRPDDLDLDIFIAPHEFFILGRGTEWVDNPALSHSVIVNTEQWQTRWFVKSLPRLFNAGAIWDLNIQSAAGLCKMGLHAEFLPLGFDENFTQLSLKGPLPELRALETLSKKARDYQPSGDDLFTDRPLDYFFVGSRSKHRARFFSKGARVLQQFDGFLHFSDSSVPLVPNDPLYINDSDAIIGLCQRSRILLNIHQSEVPYFEWQRIVFQGFWQRAVVVSEPCFLAPGFKPDVHYIEAELDEIPGIMHWLLTTKEGQEKAASLRTNAYEQLVNRFNMSKILRELLSL